MARYTFLKPEASAVFNMTQSSIFFKGFYPPIITFPSFVFLIRLIKEDEENNTIIKLTRINNV